MAFSPYNSPAVLSSLQHQNCGKETVSHSLKVTDVLSGPAGIWRPNLHPQAPQRTADLLCTFSPWAPRPCLHTPIPIGGSRRTSSHCPVRIPAQRPRKPAQADTLQRPYLWCWPWRCWLWICDWLPLCTCSCRCVPSWPSRSTQPRCCGCCVRQSPCPSGWWFPGKTGPGASPEQCTWPGGHLLLWSFPRGWCGIWD